MDTNAELELIAGQEAELWFPEFTESEAWQLGQILQEIAQRQRLAIVIDISRLDRQLFFAAMPGTSHDNQDWCRRKRNVVFRFGQSSHFIGQKMKALDTTLSASFALANCDYAAGGGAFPICVRGCGMIACVSVSGLDSRADHDLVVEALRELLDSATPSVRQEIDGANKQ